MQQPWTCLTFTKIAGKELQGKEKVQCKELKAERVSGRKNPFMKIRTLNVYVVQKDGLNDIKHCTIRFSVDSFWFHIPFDCSHPYHEKVLVNAFFFSFSFFFYFSFVHGRTQVGPKPPVFFSFFLFIIYIIFIAGPFSKIFSSPFN